MKLIIVNCGDPHEPAVVRYQPLAPAYIAAYTPPGWQVELVDENFGVFRPEEASADLVAFSALPRHIDRAYTHAAMLRARGITTVAGGMHVSALPDEAEGRFDSIVEGEAEPVWARLVGDFESGRLEPRYVSHFDADLSDLRLPDRRYVHPGYRIASASTSGACWNGCAFCYIGSYRRKRYRVIDTERVVEDFLQIPQKAVVLSDASFLGPTDAHVDTRRELCEALIRAGVRKYWGVQVTADVVRHPDLPRLMHRAGCRLAFVGFEAVGEGSLRSIRKGGNAPAQYADVVRALQSAGIAVAASFILGLDGQDGRSVAEMRAFLDSARPLFLNLGVLSPMPNTAFYHQARQQGRLLADGPALWKHLDKSTTTIRYEGFTAAEMEEAFEEVVSGFFRPGAIARTFLGHVLGRGEVLMPALYLGAALRKRKGRCRTVSFGRSLPPEREAGPPVLAPRTGAAVVSVLSWNVNQWPGLSRTKRARRDLERVREVIDGYDIVCLQECWSPESQDLRWALPFHYFDHLEGRHGLGTGLLTLSRYPIRAWYCETFSRRGLPDSLASKGATVATVEVDGVGPVDVVNAHLQAWGPRRIREAQLDELSRFLTRRARSGVRLVAGDFNLSSRAPGFEAFRRTQRLRHVLDHRAGAPAPRVDHLLCWSCEAAGLGADALEAGFVPALGSREPCPSDHRGLYGRILLSRTGGETA